jgi:hypothetical protein
MHKHCPQNVTANLATVKGMRRNSFSCIWYITERGLQKDVYEQQTTMSQQMTKIRIFDYFNVSFNLYSCFNCKILPI